MSIIVIAFPGAPKVCNEAVKCENELNELLRQKVKGKETCFFEHLHSLVTITDVWSMRV